MTSLRGLVNDIQRDLNFRLEASMQKVYRSIRKEIITLLFLIISIVFISISFLFFFIEYLSINKTLSFLIVGCVALIVALIMKIK